MARCRSVEGTSLNNTRLLSRKRLEKKRFVWIVAYNYYR